MNKDFLVVLFGKALTAAISLGTVKVITSYLIPGEYGLLSLMIMVQSFCGLFLINPIGQYINLCTHAWYDDGSLIARLRSYKKYIYFVSFIGAALSQFFIPIVGKFEFLIGSVIFLLVFWGTWNSTLIPMVNMLGFRLEAAVLSILTASASLSFSFCLIIFNPTAINWLLGQVAGLALSTIIGYIFLKNRLKLHSRVFKISLIGKKALVNYCLPLSVATGLMWFSQSGYRFLIERYWGVAELGLFAVGFGVASSIASIAETIAMQFYYPYFFRSVSGQSDEEKIQQSFADLVNILAPLYIFLAGVLILSAPFILKLMVSEQYRDCLEYLIVGSFSELFRVLTNLFSNAAHVRRNTKALAVPYAMSAFLTLVGIVVSGSWGYEVWHASFALLLGSLIMFVTMATSMLRQITMSLDLKRWTWSFLTFIFLGGASRMMPRNPEMFVTIGFLSMMFIISIIFIFFMLNKNPAVERLIKVELNEVVKL